MTAEPAAARERDHQATAPLSKSADAELCINTIRTLAMDAVEKANSGHAGAAIGLALVMYNFDVLTERGRRALRVHLKSDVEAGLSALEAALRQALG